MTQEDFFYQCIDVIEHWLNGNRKLSDLREVTDKLYDEVTKPHWISVEDELPIDYEPVLAVVGGNHFAFVGICLNKKTWYCEIQNKATEIIGITHWMPLPQAPKGGEE